MSARSETTDRKTSAGTMDHDARIKRLKDVIADTSREIIEHEKCISVLAAKNLSALAELKEMKTLQRLDKKYRGSKT